MKTTFILVLLLLFNPIARAQTQSPKRGVGYGYHSAADMLTASQGISWWYNWAAKPDAAIRTTYGQYGVEFVPQAWNTAGINGVSAWLAQDDKIGYVLGFNEPNFTAQANMTPSQAAGAWPALQAIADQYNLKLVSPAVNYCGQCVQENGTIYYSPFDWLDDFFAACPNCRVDYIALHWYGGGNSMASYVDDARKYGKPIWITEFANWEAGVSAEGQRKYLAGTTNFLERDPDVFRYAWFIGRGSGSNTYPYIDLYGDNGEMTQLGQIYLDIPVYDSTYRNPIPGRIEAEEYYRQKGVFAELTSDVDGLMNIGYTEPGDWLTYKVNLAAAGPYALTCRYAGTSIGKFDVVVDDQIVGRVNTTNTGGWQSWKSVSINIDLPAGEHLLKLDVLTNGFNINWLQFEQGYANLHETPESKPLVSVFPNPVLDNQFTIAFTNRITDDINIQLWDCTGRIVFSKQIKSCDENEILIDLGDVNNIGKGFYTLSIRNGSAYLNQKIVVF